MAFATQICIKSFYKLVVLDISLAPFSFNPTKLAWLSISSSIGQTYRKLQAQKSSD